LGRGERAVVDLAGLGSEGWAWAAITGVILAGYVVLWFSALAAAPALDVMPVASG
jgi:hypothetical protein